MISCDYTRSRITLTISLCTNMEKYAKCRSCNNIEKYANALRVSYPDRIYREIRTQFAYFTRTEHIEKYANCVGKLREIREMCLARREPIEKYGDCVGVHGIHREICEHECRIPLPKHLWRNYPEIPFRRRPADELPVPQSTNNKKKSTHPT